MDPRQTRDLPGAVAAVRHHARPWKSIIALTLAICAAVLSDQAGKQTQLFAPDQPLNSMAGLLRFTLAGAFCVLAASATYGLAGKARKLAETRIGQSHSAVIRYVILLTGAFSTLVITLELIGIPVSQLVLGGALTGVFVSLAAQQSLSNVFAGMMLLGARPFRVGDLVQLRGGSLGGPIQGVITDIGLTYVRIRSEGTELAIPNAQVLNAVVGPSPAPPVTPSPATPSPASPSPRP